MIAYGIGRAINPMLVAGQIVGGAAQGFGSALFEDFSYDEIGQPLVTTFMDYLMPTAVEMPEVEILLSEDAPSPLNPFGVKGAGRAAPTPVARSSRPPSTTHSAVPERSQRPSAHVPSAGVTWGTSQRTTSPTSKQLVSILYIDI